MLYTCICVCMYACMYISALCICVYICICIYACIFVYMYVHIWACFLSVLFRVMRSTLAKPEVCVPLPKSSLCPRDQCLWKLKD